MYTFVHPTKAGGTAVERFFRDHYSSYIAGKGHSHTCKNSTNPILIIRDVKSRFLSMYNYWKNGASDTHYTRSDDWKCQHENVSILDFIQLLKEKNKNLYCGFTWDKHFMETSHWIDGENYKNIIVIRYDDDLNDKIQCLINTLDIPNKNVTVPRLNVSIKNVDENDLQDPIILSFLDEFFHNDNELIKCVDNNPEMFKLVI